MKSFTSLVLAIFFLYTTAAFAENDPVTLSIKVKGIEQLKGTLRVAIFNQKKTFLTKDWVVGKVADANAAVVTFEFAGLEKGDYAVSLFQDLNGNEKLDKNFVGAPTEPYAFGNDAFGVFGPPTFEEASIKLVENHSTSITLR